MRIQRKIGKKYKRRLKGVNDSRIRTHNHNPRGRKTKTKMEKPQKQMNVLTARPGRATWEFKQFVSNRRITANGLLWDRLLSFFTTMQLIFWKRKLAKNVS